VIKDTIILDLDGTLADCGHRLHLASGKDWPAFHALSVEDKPHEDIMHFIEALQNGQMFNDHFSVVICTGRNEEFRLITHAWLTRHGITYDALLMRPNDDYSKDGELKVRLLAEHFGSIEEARRRVLFALDDRDTSVEGLRNAGLPVWQVRPSGY
jgi:phosphoglycolate phosphatase-like HAD superfamily hydrolase